MGGIAQRSGQIEVGDEITSINGEQVNQLLSNRIAVLTTPVQRLSGCIDQLFPEMVVLALWT
jgi:C-terminal processing protease CtpA/Prc